MRRVCDRLPRGLVFASASVKTKISDGSVCWTVASIAPHAHRQATIVVRALAGSSGKLVNHATLSGPFGRSARGARGDQGDPGAAEADAGHRLIAQGAISFG